MLTLVRTKDKVTFPDLFAVVNCLNLALVSAMKVLFDKLALHARLVVDGSSAKFVVWHSVLGNTVLLG